MAYAAFDDILGQLPEETLIELTDDAGAGEADTEVVSRAIADADALIDAHAGQRFETPLAGPPDVIRQLSVDLAVYNLYSRRGYAPPQAREERRGQALDFLARLAAGQVGLGAAIPAPLTTKASVDFNSNTRLFTRDKLRGY